MNVANGTVEGDEECIIMSDTETPVQAVTSRNSSKKRKTAIDSMVQRTKRVTKEDKMTEKQRNYEKLLDTKLIDFQPYIEKTCGLTVDTVEQQMQALEVLAGSEETYVPEVILIIFLISCREHLEKVLNPRQWEVETMVKFWEEQMAAVTVTQITNVLKNLRKTMRTVYNNCPVRLLVSTYRGSIDTSVKLLYPIDLMELFGASKRLSAFFDDIPQRTSTFAPHTKTTSTYHTFAPTATTVVDAVGLSARSSSTCGSGLSLDGLLEDPTSTLQTLQTSCDTYLRMLDAPSELVASTNLKDYLIDINIYRYVCVEYIYNHIHLIKNENIIRFKHVSNSNRIASKSFFCIRNKCLQYEKYIYVHDKSIETHISYLLIKNVLQCTNEKTNNVIGQIMHNGYLYNYNKRVLIKKIGEVINNHIFPDVCMPYMHRWHEYSVYPYPCDNCNFVHDTYVTKSSVNRIKAMYPLLSYGNIYYVLLHCNNVKSINP